MLDRLRDLRDFIRQPSQREQVRAILAELDQLRPADAAASERERARRHAEAAAAYRVLLHEDHELNCADAELDRADAVEIARLRDRERAIRWAAHERTVAQVRRAQICNREREVLEVTLRDTAPTALREALADVRALDDEAEREERSLGPLSGRWMLLRERRAACELAYRQLNELPLLGLDDQEARQRAAAVLADLRRACDEIGRRPTPALDARASRAILA
jgi:hypothetical protein